MLTERPEEVGFFYNQFGRPTTISAYDVGLQGEIHCSIGDLNNLITLSLAKGEITGDLPPQVAKIQTQKNLWIYNQRLQSIPPTLHLLPRLEELSFTGNQITHLPHTPQLFERLKICELQSNPLATPLPQSVLDHCSI